MIERKPFVRNGHTRSEQWIITILCKKAKKNAKKRAKNKNKNIGGKVWLSQS